MRNDGKLGVAAACIALEVWVLGNVAGGDGDGVDEGEGLVGTGRGVAELRVERDAVAAGGVDGEGAADALPDAGRLNCVFLGSNC